jgi:hypothetical protein
MIRYWNSEALKQQPSAFLLEEIPYKERRLWEIAEQRIKPSCLSNKDIGHFVIDN